MERLRKWWANVPPEDKQSFWRHLKAALRHLFQRQDGVPLPPHSESNRVPPKRPGTPIDQED
jgi:hypothetical protein